MNYKKIVLYALFFCFIILTTNALVILAENQDDGKVMFESKCSQCHSLSISLSKTKNLTQWEKTTLRMAKKRNSNISQEEAKKVAEYLSSITKK